ncbi:MAG: YifB family Mg chelatase-like AAA ATPase [Methylicorpusculum sp.]|uniref:YifB family Mg chelatase-like AAA ATPase n=1 Tax=Methylicorpusculum sp. TaxID=2713644 RepID=UPI002720A84E|nr:YifB family Mg chelatase-like AAA ATPase [Methylicorpusculum sp.]MDO8845315.1 YifB family Mg chelatase-like AAA ATPase [Methylicorpusculum sp.]MDO8940944.1 YifB family Mg chelatase-like AAA ATPase [Methylicorpusculum sp.]MDP2177856.1 YifB family Mg chelatase-like AAA ATPase [Methylicorpusculum sp.]MDP3529896.1 YifB family Mg chelatase-like AAA ATPase [Methylicorpusculum sp.]MDZ4152276.1 YifB family Mg chelatase-like AAA ATPase [Methylicorpusculum sp.]
MSLAIVYSRGRSGISAPLVTVEVHIANGLPALNIVGLPETAVKESKDRVRGAIINSHFDFPMERLTVNLAPADLPKEGGRFDLAIALGILAASGQIPKNRLAEFECIGELSLGGELRPISGTLPVAIQARNQGRALILPRENSAEAALVQGIQLIPAEHLLQVCAHLSGQQIIEIEIESAVPEPSNDEPDFADVHGQYLVKRAFEIAAAGNHNLLMLGPPGTGKSMLASRLPTILPLLSEAQAQETAAIASVSDQGLNVANWRKPPFRAPHHTASAAALVGGGSNPKPGEISLAHNGALFLDELPEFDRKVLEVLREPLETGHITISRAARQADFPARFQLIAAMNPCPCGYLGDPSGRCHCSSEQVARYRSRISGPLLDRIDMHLEVPRVSLEVLRKGSAQGEESSSLIRTRVMKARDTAIDRQGKANDALSAKEVKQHCPLSEQGHQLLEQAMEKFGLSHRAYHRILKVARTIADLAGSPSIEITHLSEAISYRKLDRALK